MGYADFDGKRYFDVREQDNYELINLPLDDKACLESDCRNRPDIQALLEATVEQAQENKDQLEDLQRNDRKLREAAAKRRQTGGAQIVFSYKDEE
jgi:hypothetical protein